MTLLIHILGPLGSQGAYAATDTHRGPRPGSITNISGAHTTTWEQLDVADNRAANGLQNLGIGPASPSPSWARTSVGGSRFCSAPTKSAPSSW